MASPRDAAAAAGAVLQAVSSVDLTPTESAHVMGLLDSYRCTLEDTEREARIASLEISAVYWNGDAASHVLPDS